MSPDVPAALLDEPDAGEVTDADVVDCVRLSLPYACGAIDQLAADPDAEDDDAPST